MRWLLIIALLVATAIGADTPARKRALPKVLGGPIPAAEPKPGAPAPVENVFAWDALEKIYTAKLGETETHFNFSFTNRTDREVAILNVKTSCGCTTAKLPDLPWKIAAGASGSFGVDLEFAGKSGVLVKTVTVHTTEGDRILNLRLTIPEEVSRRAMNTSLAKADRQAVFRGDCARCHVEPAAGKTGKELFAAACGICHEAEHRATMVPDLRALKVKVTQDAAYWRAWIENGKEGSLMPAFAKTKGGPLDAAQIDSLATYLESSFPVK